MVKFDIIDNYMKNNQENLLNNIFNLLECLEINYMLIKYKLKKF